MNCGWVGNIPRIKEGWRDNLVFHLQSFATARPTDHRFTSSTLSTAPTEIIAHAARLLYSFVVAVNNYCPLALAFRVSDMASPLSKVALGGWSL